MPFSFVTVGLIMIISGLRGTQGALGKQIVKDFTGDNNFLYWFLAIGLIGSVGYVDSLKSISRTFLVLIVVSMILKNGGVFAKLQDAIKQGPISPKAEGASGGASSSDAGNAAKVAETAMKVAPYLLA